MPVVPAHAEDEMPRIEIALVPELSIETPGVKRAMSWKSLMPRASIASWLSAVTLIGTLLSASSWRVAVTTISCRPLGVFSAAVGVALASSGVAAAASPLTGPAAALSGSNKAPASGTRMMARMRIELIDLSFPQTVDRPGPGLCLQHYCSVCTPAHEYFVAPVDGHLRSAPLVLGKNRHELAARGTDAIGRAVAEVAELP